MDHEVALGPRPAHGSGARGAPPRGVERRCRRSRSRARCPLRARPARTRTRRRSDRRSGARGDLHAVAATVLRLEERIVGGVDQRMFAEQAGRDADADRDLHDVARWQVDGRLSHDLAESLCELLGGRVVHALCDDHELLASPAREQVALCDGGLQSLGDGLEHGVAGRMAEVVAGWPKLSLIDLKRSMSITSTPTV